MLWLNSFPLVNFELIESSRGASTRNDARKAAGLQNKRHFLLQKTQRVGKRDTVAESFFENSPVAARGTI